MKQNTLIRIKEWLVKNFKVKVTLISCGISLFTFLLVFASGSVNKNTKREVCANYFVDISSNHIKYDGNKKISGLIVQPKEGKEAKMETDTQNAIDSLWGVFKGTNASFAPVMNANKNLNFKFVDPGYSDDVISILYSDFGCGNATEKDGYHTEERVSADSKEKEKVIIDYKFQSSPLATMFPSALDKQRSKLHIYISQSMAENYLKYHNKEITREALESFKNKEVTIDFNGEIADCIIDNIYLDNFKHDYPFPYKDHEYDYYYGTDVGTILGDYIFIYLHGIERNSIPKCFERQGLYFMSEYSYRNSFFIKYASKLYDPNDFSYSYATNNLEKDFSPDIRVLEKGTNSKLTNVWCILLSVVLILTFFSNIFIVYREKLFLQPLSLFLIVVASLLPFIFFKLIFTLTSSIYIFSSYSLILNLILNILFALSTFVFNCFGRKVNRGRINV